MKLLLPVVGSRRIDFTAFRMCFEDDKPSMPLLRAAAQDAFKGLTVSDMQTLLAHFEVPYDGRRPTLEVEVCRLLVAWQLPHLSKEEVTAIVAKRTEKANVVFATALHSENSKVLGKEGAEWLLQECAEVEKRAVEYVKKLAP